MIAGSNASLNFNKNVVVGNTHSKRVSFLSQTVPGSVDDKALADYVEVGYPMNAELKPSEQLYNRSLARVRVRVKHSVVGVKISRIAKNQLRNTADGLSDAHAGPDDIATHRLFLDNVYLPNMMPKSTGPAYP